jgi:uncharacterized protein YxeA
VIPLLIILGIVLVILILLLIPVSFSLSFNENFDYTLKYGLIKIPLDSKKTKTDKREEKKENYFKKLFREKGFDAAFSELCFYAKIFLENIFYLLKKIKFKIFNLKISVGGADAAKTAISYGVVSSAVYYVLGFIDSNVCLKIKEIDISSNFNSRTTKAEFNFKASLRLIYAFFIAFALIKIILEFKNKELVSNERQ